MCDQARRIPHDYNIYLGLDAVAVTKYYHSINKVMEEKMAQRELKSE